MTPSDQYKALVRQYADRIKAAKTETDLSSIADAINAFTVQGRLASKAVKLKFLSDVEALFAPLSAGTTGGLILKDADNKEYLRFVALIRSQMNEPQSSGK